MSFSNYPVSTGGGGLVSVSNGTFTGSAGTAINTSFRNLGTTLTSRGYDVKVAYGAVGDGSTNDTTAIQNAIDDAKAAGGGIVFLPIGTYSVSTLNWWPTVSIIGVSAQASVLKARAAGSMLSYQGDLTAANPSVVGSGRLSNFAMDGNSSTGTTGMDFRRIPHFYWDSLFIHHFSSTGMKFRGVEIGTILGVRIEDCGSYGVDSDKTTLSDSSPYASNLIVWSQCSFVRCPVGTWLKNCAQNYFLGSDWEVCGTTGNAATNALIAETQNPSNEGMGVVLAGCWFEQCHGNSLILVNPSASSPGYALVVRDTLIVNTIATVPTYGIYIDGTGSFDTKVLINAMNIAASSTTTPVKLNGAKAVLYQDVTDGCTVTNTGGTVHVATYS